MIVATSPFIAGHRIVETKGQTFGLVVRSRGFSGNLIAGLRSLGGGEIHEYTSLLEDTRRQALDRLVKNATLMGGNAVVSMNKTSPPMPVTARPVATPGTLVRSGISSSTLTRPSHVRTSAASTSIGVVASPVATFEAILRVSFPSSRSSERTPASRV